MLDCGHEKNREKRRGEGVAAEKKGKKLKISYDQLFFKEMRL
jgi:hypothetical protein